MAVRIEHLDSFPQLDGQAADGADASSVYDYLYDVLSLPRDPDGSTWIVVSQNVSSGRTMVSPTRRDSVVLFGAFLAVWAVLLNLVLCWIVTRKRRHLASDSKRDSGSSFDDVTHSDADEPLPRRPVRWLVLNHAVCQLLQAAFVLPLNIVAEFQGGWTLGAPGCRFWLVSQVFLVALNFWSLVALVVDGAAFAVNPALYRRRVGGPAAAVAVLLAWAVSLVAVLPTGLLMGRDDFVLDEVCALSIDYESVFSTAFSVYFIPASFIISGCVIMAVRACVVCRDLRCMRKDAFGGSCGTLGTAPATMTQAGDEITLHTSADLVVTVRDSAIGRYLSDRHGACCCCPAPTYATYGDYSQVLTSSLPVLFVSLFCVGMWAPFYATNFVIPQCEGMCVDPTLWTLFIWLGYAITGLVPIIWFLHPEVKGQMKLALKRKSSFAHAQKV